MQEVDRFTCEDDEGVRYEVIERQRTVTRQLLSGHRGQAPGSKDWILSAGGYVNCIDGDDRTFEILDSGKKIRRI